MSDSLPTDPAAPPETPDLAEANMKLRSATERLRQLNEETGATSASPGPGVTVEKP